MVGAPGFCLLYGGLASPLPLPCPDPCGGQAPALQSPLRTPLDSGFRRNDKGMPRMTNERLLERSVFIAITHAGCRRHAKV